MRLRIIGFMVFATMCQNSGFFRVFAKTLFLLSLTVRVIIALSLDVVIVHCCIVLIVIYDYIVDVLVAQNSQKWPFFGTPKNAVFWCFLMSLHFV